MPEPDSRIRVAIQDHVVIDGIAVTIALRDSSTQYRILHFDEHGAYRYDITDPAAQFEPSFRLNHEFARALLDALLRHYQGASDMHQLRQDYLHERGRVDNLLNWIMNLASNINVNVHHHESEQ